MDTRFCLHPVILDEDLAFPCGKCPVCRMKYRKQMALRIYMEQSIDKPAYSYFLTLTYDPEHIPVIEGRNCFCKEHLQRFLDSLRHKLRNEGFSLRYFATCEYGEEGYRPHYHFIFFLYGSGKLHRHEFNRRFVSPLWHYGFTFDGTVTIRSIMYCTAYALKDDESLERDWTGFEEGRPFRLFSMRPGLGLTDSCINWWTNYIANGGELRNSIRVRCAKRSVSGGIPVGVKRKISDSYSDIHERLKEANMEYFIDSISSLLERAERYGSSRNYTNKNGVDPIDYSPDREIQAFRKALRRIASSERNPLK